MLEEELASYESVLSQSNFYVVRPYEKNKQRYDHEGQRAV